jgi:hypothetical protein
MATAALGVGTAVRGAPTETEVAKEPEVGAEVFDLVAEPMANAAANAITTAASSAPQRRRTLHPEAAGGIAATSDPLIVELVTDRNPPVCLDHQIVNPSATRCQAFR